MITICVWLASNKPGDEDECKDNDNEDDEEDGNENETDQSVIKWNSRQDTQSQMEVAQPKAV